MAVQIIITPAYFPWQEAGVKNAGLQIYDEHALRYVQNPQRQVIMRKATFQGGKAAVRLIVGSANTQIDPFPYLTNLAGTFGAFSLGEGNQFVFHRPLVFKDRFIERIKERRISYFENKNQILNAQELASMWHPPGHLLSGIKNINWGGALSTQNKRSLV